MSARTDDEGVRTYKPRASAPAKPAPSEPDPFAAWDALPPVDARPKSAVSAEPKPRAAKPVEIPPRYTAEEIAAARRAMNMPDAAIRPGKAASSAKSGDGDVRVAPASPAARPASAPEIKPAPKKSSEEFTLEDILAEYGGK